jgi:hypothetical protein
MEEEGKDHGAEERRDEMKKQAVGEGVRIGER